MDKWLIEAQSDGESEAFRILQVGEGTAELRYIAVDEDGATDLVTALNWLDTFKSGMLAIPAKPKAKKEKLVFELEIEKPKKTVKKRKTK